MKAALTEQQAIENIRDLIEEGIDDLSARGRDSEGKQLLDIWSNLWWILHRVKHSINDFVDFKAKIKAHVVEEVAREILVPHGIDLDKIISRYKGDDC